MSESSAGAWRVYVNGDMVPWFDARISVLDRGFQYGDGVFEGIRAYDGRIFQLDQHVGRLYRSARAIGIRIPIDVEEFKAAIRRVVRENGFRDAHIKPHVTRGNAPTLGLDARNTTEPNIVIVARPISGSVFDQEKGLSLASVSVRKIPPACIDPRIKSIDYLVNILARAEAVSSGADEAIMLDLDGNVSEGAGDNLFLVRDGKLFTPRAEDALEGITRAAVIEMSAREGIAVHETTLRLYDFYTADEVFATGTAAGVIAVTEIDKRAIAGGRPGPMTGRIVDLYAEEVQKGDSAYAQPNAAKP